MKFSNFLFSFLITFSTHNICAQAIIFSHNSGFYETDFNLTLTTNTNFQIRYTIDGKNPSKDSPLFENLIHISDRSLSQNTISNIPTNPPNTDPEIIWQAPKSPILKSTIIRAALFFNETKVSANFGEEYFIGDAIMNIQMPIFSIWADSLGLFGYETGIYIPGKDYDDNPFVWQPGNYHNTGDDWERGATLSYYQDLIMEFKHLAEFEIHGGGSRKLPCKSLRISAKESLGQPYFEMPFFEEKNITDFKKLVLRNSGQNFTKSLFADVLMHELLRHQNIEYLSSLPSILFLNGSYWGIHNLRERYDKYYFQNYHNEELEAIDYFEIAMQYNDKEGSSLDYQILIEDILSSDCSEEILYQKITEQIDIENFIIHHISKIYGGGIDWSGNNERLWRSQHSDSKWRWVANDYDDAFGNYEKDSYKHATKTDGINWPNPEWSTRLFRILMTNQNFSILYKTQLKFHLENTFSPEIVKFKIDSLAAIYRAEIPQQIIRWNYPKSVENWENVINEMKEFAEERSDFVWENFNEYFPNIYLNPTNLLAYPNPTEELFFVEIPKDWEEKSYYSIYNLSGKKIQEGPLFNNQKNEIKLNSNLKGIYSIHLFDSRNNDTIKLFIH